MLLCIASNYNISAFKNCLVVCPRDLRLVILCVSVTRLTRSARLAGISIIGEPACRACFARFLLKPFDAHCCHMGTAIKHPVPEWVKLSSVMFNIRAL